MNIAFPALFIFALLLPGFVFLSAFERKENTRLERRPFETSSGSAFLAAATIHLILAWLSHQIQPIDFSLCWKLLTGNKPSPVDIQKLANSSHLIGTYFIVAFISAFALGKLIQAVILEVFPYKSSRFSFDTPWYYELKGKLSEEDNAQIIKLSCLEDTSEGSYLYYGYLKDFYLDPDGQLDRIALSNVHRRHIKDDDEENRNNRFYPIKGDRLILKYCNIRNINIEYFYITEIE